MNFSLDGIPKRSPKPRNSGLTMIMDKGLSTQEAENLIESGSEYIDLAGEHLLLVIAELVPFL